MSEETATIEVSAGTKELGDKIAELTLKQAKELSDYLKDEYGIEPAAAWQPAEKTRLDLAYNLCRDRPALAEFHRSGAEHRGTETSGIVAREYQPADGCRSRSVAALCRRHQGREQHFALSSSTLRLAGILDQERFTNNLDMSIRCPTYC